MLLYLVSALLWGFCRPQISTDNHSGADIQLNGTPSNVLLLFYKSLTSAFKVNSNKLQKMISWINHLGERQHN